MSILASARDVLDLLVSVRRELTVTEVAEALQQPKSSASRTLGLMAEHGFLERNPATLAYRPGRLVTVASAAFREAHGAAALLGDELTLLVEQTGFTGYVSALDGTEALVLQMRANRKAPLQAYTPEGSRTPAYATSLGRAVLSRLSDEDVRELFPGDLPHATGSAPRDADELVERLAEIRRSGWSISEGEFVAQVAGVAAAVMDPATGMCCGLALAVPADRFDTALRGELAGLVRAAAWRVGGRIGDPYWLARTETD